MVCCQYTLPSRTNYGYSLAPMPPPRTAGISRRFRNMRTTRAAGRQRDTGQRRTELRLPGHRPDSSMSSMATWLLTRSKNPAIKPPVPVPFCRAIGNRLKAAFALVLVVAARRVWLSCSAMAPERPVRTALSGRSRSQTYGYNGPTLPAELPFRGLSFPDINQTIMRPASLPPSIYTNPVLASRHEQRDQQWSAHAR